MMNKCKKYASQENLVKVIICIFAIYSILHLLSSISTESIKDAKIVTEFKENLEHPTNKGVKYYSGKEIASLSEIQDNILVRNLPTKQDAEWLTKQDEATRNLIQERIALNGVYERTIYRLEGVDSKGNYCYQAIYKHR